MRKERLTRPRLPLNRHLHGHRLDSRGRNAAGLGGIGSYFFIEAGKMKFKVTLTRSRGWRTWRADRRLYRVTFVSAHDSLSAEDHLILNMACNDAILQLVQAVVNDVQRRHRIAGRPENALVRLALTADGLTHPVLSQMANLFHPDLIGDFIDTVTNVFVSHAEVSIEDGFEFDVVVIDDATQPGLIYAAGRGKTYRREKTWTFPQPEKWKKYGFHTKRFMKLMPDFSQADAEYANCCLLAAIVYSLRYNRSQRETDAKYVVMSRINNGFMTNQSAAQKHRSEKAVEVLRQEMGSVVDDKNLNLSVFRMCNIFNPLLAAEVEKLGINLVLYRDDANFKPVLQLPEVYDHSKESVHVLLLHSVGNVHHASSILRPWTFNSKYLNMGTYCMYCKREFSGRYALQHKCSSRMMPQRCSKCGMVKRTPEMYYDNTVAKMVCEDVKDYEERCRRCRKMFFSEHCMKMHNLDCRTNTKQCPDCGQVYRDETGKLHKCYTVFCRHCLRRHPIDEAAGDGSHFCEMRRPEPQKKYNKMAFFDTGMQFN